MIIFISNESCMKSVPPHSPILKIYTANIIKARLVRYIYIEKRQEKYDRLIYSLTLYFKSFDDTLLAKKKQILQYIYIQIYYIVLHSIHNTNVIHLIYWFEQITINTYLRPKNPLPSPLLPLLSPSKAKN